MNFEGLMSTIKIGHTYATLLTGIGALLVALCMLNLILRVFNHVIGDQSGKLSSDNIIKFCMVVMLFGICIIFIDEKANRQINNAPDQVAIYEADISAYNKNGSTAKGTYINDAGKSIEFTTDNVYLIDDDKSYFKVIYKTTDHYYAIVEQSAYISTKTDSLNIKTYNDLTKVQ